MVLGGGGYDDGYGPNVVHVKYQFNQGLIGRHSTPAGGLRPRWQNGGGKCFIFLRTTFTAKTPWGTFRDRRNTGQVSYLAEEVDKDTGRTTA